MTTRATEAVETPRVEDAAPSPFQPTVQPTAPAGIRMRGYLKKKRNRMGGWRKLYVVLQSQLLLSYASRRDYERRLAPFEDIINLVPGTRILPSAASLRFTIETTSRNFYTFRCVDHRNCSEWITALLDSLQQGGCSRVGAGTARDRQFGQPSADHRTATSPVWASLSMEQLGLARSQSSKTMDGELRSVRGLRGSGLGTKQQQQQQQQLDPFQRRHPIMSSAGIPAPKASATATTTTTTTTTTDLRHVKEVHRAEMKMDDRRGVELVEKHDPRHSDDAFADEIITKAFQFLSRPKRSRDMTASEILEYYLERRQRLQLTDQGLQQPPQQQQQCEQIKANAERKEGAVRCMPGTDTPGTSPAVRACLGMEEATIGTSGRESLVAEDDATDQAEQQQQQQQQKAMEEQAATVVRFWDFRLHPVVDRPIVESRSQSVDVSRINSMFGEQQQQQQQQPQRELRQGSASPIINRPVAPSLREAGQRVSSSCSDLPPVMRQLAAGTFVASISGPVGPGATYTRRPSRGREACGYEYIPSHSSSNSSSSSSSSSNGSSCSSVRTLTGSRRIELTEPIYAVVDVNAKRFRRKQQQEELPEESHSSGPQHHHYEEALPIIGNCSVSEGAKEDDLLYDQQHIYEPIMIPAQPAIVASTTAIATVCDREHRWRRLWRNLKRIRLHPGRNRRPKTEQPSTVAEQPSTGPPATSSTSNSNSSSSTTTTTTNSSSGHQRAGLIAGLGSRLDSHRQSMKKRAKSLYDATSNAA